MNLQTMTRRQLLGATAAGAAGMGVTGRFGAASAWAAGPGATTIVYDDFSDGGASYASKWFVFPIAEPEALSSRNFDGGALHLRAVPFTLSFDFVLDHLKYLAVSLQRFPIPASGSLSVSADIAVQTPGTSPGRVVPTTGRVLLDPQQAAATLHLLDSVETGQLFDWFVSEHKAFALYERLFVGVGLDKGFTQITGAPNNNHGVNEPFEPKSFASQDFDIAPGPHRYEIRYSRGGGSGADLVEWLIDGAVRARVRNVGVPLDVQNPGYYKNSRTITYPSQGPGEELKNTLTGFQIGHGIFTLVDEFPFNQFPPFVSIPTEERIFGQGAAATYDNFTVTTTTHA
jgi:hypothetical protein